MVTKDKTNKRKRDARLRPVRLIVKTEFAGGVSHEQLFSDFLRHVIETKAQARQDQSTQSHNCPERSEPQE